MINVLLEQHQQILSLFNKYKVLYMLVGGYAVNYYGFVRATGDMDLWIAPTNENKLLIIKALTEYGIEKEDIEELSTQDFSKHLVFSIGRAPEKIDFITRVNLAVFSDSYPHREVFELDGIDIPVIRYEELILTKFNTGRPKDQIDIETLQEIRKKEY